MEKIGELFVKAGLISNAQLGQVLEENRTHPDEKLGQTLVRLNLGSETEVARALSFQSGMSFIDLNTVVIDPLAIKKIPLSVAMQHHLLPVYVERNDLILAIEDPHDFEALEAARFASGLNIRPHLAAASELMAAINRYYAMDESMGDMLQNVTPSEDLEFILEYVPINAEQIAELKAQSESPAIVKLVNTIIFQAIAAGASAIQLEPRPQEVVVKHRIDGVLVESMRTPRWTQGSLISRIKLMGGLDLTKRHVPQEGQITLKMQQHIIELGISSRPMEHGEGLYLQILDTGERIPLLTELGLRPDDLTTLQESLRQPQGLILVCGPSASGKTTTLYSLLNELLQQQRRIITLETSISYRLKGSTQVKVNEQTGLTFAKAIHSVLRHNPDVIMVDAIRDQETAELAVHASTHGQLILSTLRTHDIMTTITRLNDLGVDPKSAASALSCLVSQRLVRKICEHCRATYQPDVKILKKIEARTGEAFSGVFYHGQGCAACHYTGYQGRIGVFHVVPTSTGFQKFIRAGAGEERMPRAIKIREAELLLKDLLDKVTHGITTVEEVERVLFAPDEFERAGVLTNVQGPQPVEAERQESPAGSDPLVTPSSPGIEPIRDPIQIAAPRDAADDGYRFKSFKILLVEDDDDLLQRLRLLLLEKQFIVTTAVNGADALEQLARDKPHLVIADINMPKMDGLELIRRLRKDITTAFIPVIILSARNTTADRLKGFAVGTDDYLPKPFSIHELFFRINAILKRVYK